ncbi:MAG: hypothetical protein ACT6FD_07275, partial [Methanosarcinaceae archaeon]
ENNGLVWGQCSAVATLNLHPKGAFLFQMIGHKKNQPDISISVSVFKKGLIVTVLYYITI